MVAKASVYPKVSMNHLACFRLSILTLTILYFSPVSSSGQTPDVFVEGSLRATIATNEEGNLRIYELSSNAELRDNQPPDKRITFSEKKDHARIRTGNLFFDGLYALAISEALQNSVSQIKDGAYGRGEPIQLEAFQTGEFWTYVWTRDLSYSTHLALAGFDPGRAVHSLLFKSSALKPSVTGGFAHQIVQDTGSGGSYPVSGDRIVWILGASETLKFLPEPEQKSFLQKVWPILHDTLEQDRRVLFDSEDGLYRGEQSFLDWREQTYPGWTKDNVITIAMSKALSVNAANYFALLTASGYAGRLGLHDDQTRYADWAEKLKSAINRHFFDPETGLYSTYLLTDSAYAIRAHRYDLLGESLAVLLGVADDAQAGSVLSQYPTGPYGPPVVWPQEHTVPIYHNHAIWPFVTAYWTKAARKANNPAAVDQGIHSLMRGATFNLSNMENFDFATGKAQVKGGALSGPVINSRRQIWSVAGYLSMVQDVVFGLETSWDGIRFLPFVTKGLRNATFGSTNLLELQNFNYRGKLIQVRVHLPPTGTKVHGPCGIGKIELNRKPIGKDFVAATSLQSQNQWDVYLQAPAGARDEGTLELVTNIADGRAIFGPLQPEWENTGQDGITVENGLLMLHYRQADASNVVFNIYRDGQLCAKRVSQTHWLDPDSSDYTNKTHFYAVEAMDEKSGNASHLTPTRFYATTNDQWIIPAKEMENHGGKLADGRYFTDWGKTDHELRVKNFIAKRNGRHLVRAEFSNGTGPVNTGITCAVKKLEIREKDSGTIVATGYLVMPQSGDWRRFDLSSAVRADLKAGKNYSIRIFEDEYSRNMSYLAHNKRYTAWPGGGDTAYNFVNIASIRLLHLAD
jgi:Bacterial alpha-L-rhamnosidase 6 hairpin glycosidase domain